MSDAYDSGAWQTFYAMVGGATAALAGLLFVALSLHLQPILTNPTNQARAREALGGFISLLALAILVLIPGQGPRLLGAELLCVGLIEVAISVHFQGETLRRLSSQSRLNWLLHLAPLDLGTTANLIAGASLLLGRGGGLFWLVPTVFSYLLYAIVNAWTLTVRPSED